MIVTDLQDAASADVVIIGSGPGGSVIAETLAADGRDVLLLEEGPYLAQDSVPMFSYQEMTDKYRNAGMTVAFGSPDVAYAEGSCVGGGSEVNSGLYHRTPGAIYEEWSDLYQLQQFSQQAMEPWFDAVEAVMQPQTYPDQLPIASEVMRRGASAFNWNSNDIPRLVRFGDERDQHGAKIPRRFSMTESFLPKYLAQGGRLLADTRVDRLARNADGSWTIRGQHKTSASALSIQAKHVFVCCGAVHTPALLRRSGIKRNVGNSLALQPMVKITAAFDEQVNFDRMGIAGEQVKEFSPNYSFGCSISSKAHLAINLLPVEGGPEHALSEYEHLISYYVMARGTPSGSVRNLPGFKSPLVRYGLSEGELHNLAHGVEDLTTLMIAAGAKRVYTGVREQPVINNENECANLPDTLRADSANVMTVHLMGACPLGENAAVTAANSYGAVHNAPNLYVSDASSLCNSLAVNPQGSIMALAKRNAAHFLDSHS